MLINYKTSFHLSIEDYQSIREQMREKKIKVTDFCKKYKISRTHFYDMARGKMEARKLLIALDSEEIYVPYKIGGDLRLEWWD